MFYVVTQTKTQKYVFKTNYCLSRQKLLQVEHSATFDLHSANICSGRLKQVFTVHVDV